MLFDELDKKMRKYEQSLDQVLLPELFIAARLDGRGFTRLTKEICQFEAPFDVRFRDMMIHTVKSLMDCGFRIVYGYTESDEISLLFHPEDNTFGRKVRKINSTLAGEASAAFSLELGKRATFDCRVIPLPTVESVVDYFRWRQEDAHRNSLNAHCYWMLRKEGVSELAATQKLEGKSISFKNELLFSRGINYDKLPAWQKRGIGLWKETYVKEGYDPIRKAAVPAVRNRLTVCEELPLGEEYAKLIRGFLEKQEP